MTAPHAMPTDADVTAAIDPLRVGLNADGYDMEIAGIDDKIRLRVVTMENPCEDCLVPHEVMARIVASKLQEQHATVTADDILISYPAEH